LSPLHDRFLGVLHPWGKGDTSKAQLRVANTTLFQLQMTMNGKLDKDWEGGDYCPFPRTNLRNKRDWRPRVRYFLRHSARLPPPDKTP